MTSAKFKQVFCYQGGHLCSRKQLRDQPPSYAHFKCYLAVSFQGMLVPGAVPRIVQSFWICIHAGNGLDVFVCLFFFWTLWFWPDYPCVHLHTVAQLVRFPYPFVQSKAKPGGGLDNISKSLLGQRTWASWAATSFYLQWLFLKASGLCVCGNAETNRGQRSSSISVAKEIIGIIAT